MKSRDLALGMMSLLLTVTGCKSTRDWRNEADSHAEALIKDAQGKGPARMKRSSSKVRRTRCAVV